MLRTQYRITKVLETLLKTNDLVKVGCLQGKQCKFQIQHPKFRQMFKNRPNKSFP